MKNMFTIVTVLFVIATFVMTGVYQDDEFAEYDSFMKYRPDVQFYFKSPLGMSDMPKDYPPKLIAEEAKYDDFIHAKHWSDRFDGLAMLLQPLAVLGICCFYLVGLKVFLKAKDSIYLKITDENNKLYTAGFPKKAKTKH